VWTERMIAVGAFHYADVSEETGVAVHNGPPRDPMDGPSISVSVKFLIAGCTIERSTQVRHDGRVRVHLGKSISIVFGPPPQLKMRRCDRAWIV
jgi:hypothetical protein